MSWNYIEGEFLKLCKINRKVGTRDLRVFQFFYFNDHQNATIAEKYSFPVATCRFVCLEPFKVEWYIVYVVSDHALNNIYCYSGRPLSIIQKNSTVYPDWCASFDVSLSRERLVQVSNSQGLGTCCAFQENGKEKNKNSILRDAGFSEQLLKFIFLQVKGFSLCRKRKLFIRNGIRALMLICMREEWYR